MGVIVIIGGIFVAVKSYMIPDEDTKSWLIGGIVAILVGLLVSVGTGFWLYGTEAGARAQKSFSSNVGGGLTRVVKVYDMEGDLIASYEGRFDVDANDQHVIFDSA